MLPAAPRRILVFNQDPEFVRLSSQLTMEVDLSVVAKVVATIFPRRPGTGLRIKRASPRTPVVVLVPDLDAHLEFLYQQAARTVSSTLGGHGRSAA